MIQKGIFGLESCFEERFIPDYALLEKRVLQFRDQGLKIVLTQGTYDLPHIGHAKYLEVARSHGDLLIVGVDSDEKVKKRKGPMRPVVPEMERLQMLTHFRGVDIVTLKHANAEKLSLIKVVRPDVLVVSKSTDKRIEDKIPEYKEFCGEVIVLEPQAVSTTSARVRLLHMNGAKRLVEELEVRLSPMVQDALHAAMEEKRT